MIILTFSNRLKFLMDLTSTSNKQLADAVSVDPSLISLMRTGRREPSRNNTHIKKMADYFSRKCDEKYQRIALSEAMGQKMLPIQLDQKQLADIIFEWLTDTQRGSARFLNTFHNFSFSSGECVDSNGSSSSIFYGNEGKRAAFDAFFDMLLSLNTIGTVLYCSDENTEWLYEDSTYYSHMKIKRKKLLNKKMRIKIIARPVYTIEDIYESVTNFLPAVTSGLVDYFFYPRLRDNVYHRTLAVLPGVCALVSSSVGNSTVCRYTVFTKDAQYADSLAGEFYDYFDKCKPVLSEYSPKDDVFKLFRSIVEFETEPGDRIQQCPSLPILVTPPTLTDILVAPLAETEREQVGDVCRQMSSEFLNGLEEHKAVDFINIATPAEIESGTIASDISFISTQKLYYNKSTYITHLNAVLKLLKTQPNYSVILHSNNNLTFLLTVKGERPPLLVNSKMPSTIFEIKRPNYNNACREYLLRPVEQRLSSPEYRAQVIKDIEKAIHDIEIS